MTTQIQDPRYFRRSLQPLSIFIIVAILLVVSGMIISILNIGGIIQGPWAAIMGVIFSVLGVFFTILQWHSQISNRSPSSPIDPFVPLMQQRYYSQIRGVDFIASINRGALLIRVNKELRGATVNLSLGFDNLNPRPGAAANIIERKLNRRDIYTAFFPSLKPGNYTVYTNSQVYAVNVTVYAGLIAEVDWR